MKTRHLMKVTARVTATLLIIALSTSCHRHRNDSQTEDDMEPYLEENILDTITTPQLIRIDGSIFYI